MSNIIAERVISVHHWNDTLFSFKTSRDPSFRFKNGHFTMIGLPQDGRPLMRAYSIVSANYEDELEFCRMLPEKVGVAAIPTSVFYDHRRDGRYLVRFAFCKTLPVIEAGLERLQKLKK